MAKRGLQHRVLEEQKRRAKEAKEQERRAREQRQEQQRLAQEREQKELRRIKEEKEQHLAKRQEHTNALNQTLEKQHQELLSILSTGLELKINIDKALSSCVDPPPNQLKAPIPPDRTHYEQRLPEPGIFEKLFGIGWSKRLRISQEIMDEYHRRVVAFENQQRRYNDQVVALKQIPAAQFRQKIADKDPASVAKYMVAVLSSSPYPEKFPTEKTRAIYNPENENLFVEREFPSYEALLPRVKGYKFIKTRDEIVELYLTQADIKKFQDTYKKIIAEITLRTLHEVFAADFAGIVTQVIFNGMVLSTDKSTGKDVRPCLVSLHASQDEFLAIDLSRVEPDSCLRYLKAQTSPSYRELVPVKPVVEFKMSDPRFIDEVDVVSQLDTRPNLLDMDPFDFEQLVCNLFTRIGLKTSTTRASRDGGVDVVAFDERPIFGGKIIIQAKRYRNTVEVSAIRDLFGAVHNEGAIKGILVTTSSFGTESYKFAKDKPLELIDGNRLLYLLEENEIAAKIEIPM